MKNIFFSHSVGISIDDHSIEIAELAQFNRPRIKNLGRKTLEPGVVEEGRIKNEQKLFDALKKTLLEAEPRPILVRKATFALPENLVYSHFFVSKESEDLTDTLRKEAEKNIPLDRRDLVFSRSSLSIIASSREWLNEWEAFFQKLRIEIAFFDPEPAALFRGLANQKEDLALALVELGKTAVFVSFFDRGVFHSSYALPGIGEVDLEKENLSGKNDKNFFTVIKALEPIAAEIARGVSYFKKTTGHDIKKIVLGGELARLGGSASFFETNLSIPAEIGVSIYSSGTRCMKAVGAALALWDMNSPRLALSGNDARKNTNNYFSRKNIVMAMGVLVFLLLVGLRWNTKKMPTFPLPQATIVSQPAAQFSKKEILNIKIPLAFKTASYTDQNLHGRSIEITSQKSVSESEAIIFSLSEAEKELRSGEKLAPAPISSSKEAYVWVAYPDADAKQLFTVMVENLNTRHIQYQLESIEITTLEKTDDPKVMNLVGKVTLSNNESIQSGTYVLVKSTETGWLNVRETPSVSGTLIQKVNPGEKYMLVDESNGWFKIKISEGKEGWAAAKYLEKIK